jgi:L,D-peptidoglycan transpeptidase YkuD (ErfK/YbiS/YcfS/YnhG family)
MRSLERAATALVLSLALAVPASNLPGTAAYRAGQAPLGASSPAAAATPQPEARQRQACPDNLPARLRATDGAVQLVTVEAAGFGTSVATVELWQRRGACWARAGGPWPSLIGGNGFSDHHREGDLTTPTGIYRIGLTAYGNDPNPGYRGPYHRLVCGDWWDEDPTSPQYNTFQHVPCGQGPPFGGDSEPLWTETSYYPSFVVVEYNIDPVVPYAGSAIFLHASTGAPTTGCVSIAIGELDDFLRWLRPSASAAIAMGPVSELTRF